MPKAYFRRHYTGFSDDPPPVERWHEEGDIMYLYQTSEWDSTGLTAKFVLEEGAWTLVDKGRGRWIDAPC